MSLQLLGGTEIVHCALCGAPVKDHRDDEQSEDDVAARGLVYAKSLEWDGTGEGHTSSESRVCCGWRASWLKGKEASGDRR